jgi:hypothetical protein
MSSVAKRAKITDEHRQEASKLKALWDSRPHRTQAVFGEAFDLGNQANVGHYLNGRSALNPKAAAAFAQELSCKVEDFSPRVAAELRKLSHVVPGALADVRYQATPELGEDVTRNGAVAHGLIYPKLDTPPITHWGVVVSLEAMPVVPADLMVEVPDDALAARGVAKGQHIWFKAANSAEPRNVVLIEANGRRYIRRYAEDGQGPFAQALDDAYPSFRDFKIVAVMFMRPAASI